MRKIRNKPKKKDGINEEGLKCRLIYATCATRARILCTRSTRDKGSLTNASRTRRSSPATALLVLTREMIQPCVNTFFLVGFSELVTFVFRACITISKIGARTAGLKFATIDALDARP